MSPNVPGGAVNRILQDAQVMQAVSRILQRSERQVDEARTLQTFVDTGVLAQLDNRNHQVLYGRRGTGKTHVFKVLNARLGSEKRNVVVYLDARTLGSSAQFSDSTLPMRRRCLALFRDILMGLYGGLLECIVERPSSDAARALDAADALLESIREPSRFLTTEKLTMQSSAGTNWSAGVATTAGIPVQIEAKRSAGTTTGATVEASYARVADDKVEFPTISQLLTESLARADAELYLLLDEWSSLPQDLQPYLAEFLKRGLLPVERVTVKIAALEYRSRFSEEGSQGRVGFELGADIATSLDLDDYYVFDRNPARIAEAYADILLRHLSVSLPSSHLKDAYGVETGRDLATKLFTQKSVSDELARAAEGVVRDLINIFTKAFFHAQRRDRDTIDAKAVREGAREWFEQDKARDLDSEMLDCLRRIVDDVIGTRRARAFLLPRELERHWMVQRLIDARVLHQIQRGYADKDHPGVRYNIYSLDFGTYVDLIGTSKAPELGFEETSVEAESIVPFDDKRSIRRIVLDESVLKVALPRPPAEPVERRELPRSAVPGGERPGGVER